MRKLELWGGHECTVNRVRDCFLDQTVRSGHQARIDDLDRFAELGISALRYPVLWERTAPDRPQEMDFTWSDARIERLQCLKVRPIVGLLHHGSGPRYTSLIDDEFPRGLAIHAHATVRRYPHVRDWTPVNEPLTTARFACLYGHWYPHQRDEHLFWLALLNQIDAIRLAMREIRAVNPEARLIQTEDLGRTYATRPAARQADFENQRRWLTWDLLSGRLTREHPLWDRISSHHLADRLAAIADNPSPPDVIGVNHYLTSERLLDHRLELYPPERHGGNDEIAYADVEAVRALMPEPGGLAGVLAEAWTRYGRTLAVTEAHNGCTREEQVRWLRDAWAVTEHLRAQGVAIEAVTAWALLGAYDWNTLLTHNLGYYECGAFDVRSGSPRPTALAAAMRTLADPGRAPHPTALGAGWWRRDIRLQYSPVIHGAEAPEHIRAWRTPKGCERPLLITGATGTLGRALARACRWRGVDYLLTDRSMLSLDDQRQIAVVLDEAQPWAVINAAGWVRVDDAEADEDACMAANASGAVRLAEACRARDIGFVGFSSDLVFDGGKDHPYLETDIVGPLSAYGRSKVRAEAEVLALGGRALMVRTAAFFSPYDPHNFAFHVHRSLALDQPFEAAEDLAVSPTFLPDLVDAVLDLVIDGETGLWHLANQGAVSWAQFARMIAGAFGFSERLIQPRLAQEFRWPAARPTYAALASVRGQLLPNLEHALARHAAMVRASHAPEGVAHAPPAQAPRVRAASGARFPDLRASL